MNVCSLPTKSEVAQVTERVAAEEAAVTAQMMATSATAQRRFRLTIEYCAHIAGQRLPPPPLHTSAHSSYANKCL